MKHKSLYSLSYKDETTIGELAGFVENFRNTPGVGLLAPFGRFFNNTVAFSMDMTGISFLQKLASPTSHNKECKRIRNKRCNIVRFYRNYDSR